MDVYLLHLRVYRFTTYEVTLPSREINTSACVFGGDCLLRWCLGTWVRLVDVREKSERPDLSRPIIYGKNGEIGRNSDRQYRHAS